MGLLDLGVALMEYKIVDSVLNKKPERAVKRRKVKSKSKVKQSKKK